MAKEKIIIDLILSELVYDIQERTHKIGEFVDNGENAAAVSLMQVSNDEDIKNVILRKIETATASIKVMLEKYMDNKLSQTDNILRDDCTNITLVLNVPGNFNHAVVDRIIKAAHDYIVHSVIGDWFMLTNPERAEEYIKQAAIDETELLYSINTRVRPERPI